MSAVLDGRVAIVTGGGRGLGRTIAAALVSSGASVVVADHGTGSDGSGADPTIARDVASALGKTAIAFTDSVASPGAARAVVDLAVRTFGGIDIVINGVSISRQASVFAIGPHDWEAVIRTNLSAPFYLTAAASAVMRIPGGVVRSGHGKEPGRIINLIGSRGLDDAAGQSAEATASAGLIALTRAAAADLAAYRITVNAVLRPRGGDTPHDAGAPLATPDEQRAAQLVVALCDAATPAISGRLLEVRDRDVFVFDHQWSTPHRLDVDAEWSIEALISTLRRDGAGTTAAPPAVNAPVSPDTTGPA